MNITALTLAAADALTNGNEPEAAHGVLGYSIQRLETASQVIQPRLVFKAIDVAVTVGDGPAADALVRRSEAAPLPDDPKEAGALLLRTGRRKWARGAVAAALKDFDAAKTQFVSGKHDRDAAIASGEIADVLAAQGDVGEALRIRREEELPVYERLGDVRSKAVTMGKIADVLAAQGDVGEALRIRREEQLPVFERLGDVREKSATLFNIAQALLAADGLNNGKIQEIYEALSEAYGIVVSLSIPDGIAAVGSVLAQIFAVAQEREKAIEVLDAVTQAYD
ncbi:MAG: hypothetical protein ABJV68_02975, partial [Paracoccaceae bacterium]